MVVNSRVKVSGVSAARSGRGIASVEVNSDGHLIVTYTDDTTTDAGLVSQGTSGGGTGATGRGVASLSISNGHLVAHYTDNATQDVGQVVGTDGASSNGAAGRGIASAVISTGHLVLTFTDDATLDLGQVVGPKGTDGRGVSTMTVNGDGDLVVTYTDDSTHNAGHVVGAAGQDGSGGGGSSSSFNPRGAFNPQSDYAPGDVVLLNGGQASFYFTQACASGQFDGSQGFALGVNGEYVAEAVGPAVAQYLQDHPVSGGGGTSTPAPVPGALSAPQNMPVYETKGAGWDGNNAENSTYTDEYETVEFVAMHPSQSYVVGNPQVVFPDGLDTNVGILDISKYTGLTAVGGTVVESHWDGEGFTQGSFSATSGIGAPHSLDAFAALAGYTNYGALQLLDTPTGTVGSGVYANSITIGSAWNSQEMILVGLNCTDDGGGYFVLLTMSSIDSEFHYAGIATASVFRANADGSYASVAGAAFTNQARYVTLSWTTDHLLISNQSNETIEVDLTEPGLTNYLLMNVGHLVSQVMHYNASPTDYAFQPISPRDTVGSLTSPGRVLMSSQYTSLVAVRARNKDGVAGPLSAVTALAAAPVPDPHPNAHFNKWTPLSAEVKLGDSGDPEATIHAMPPSTAPMPSLFDFRAFMLRTDGAVIPLLTSFKTKVDQGDGSVIFKCAPYLQYGQTLDPGVFTMMTYSQADTLQLRNDDLNFDVSVTVKPINYPQAEISAQWSPAQIQAQPSGYSIARAVKYLTIWNDRIYASYGDVNEDTGPIDVMSMDLSDTSAGFISEATLTTEQLGPYRAFGDKLYAVFMDPQGGIGNPENGMYAWRTTSDPTWHTVPNTTPYAEHVYDIAVLANGDIFLCGLAETVDGDTADLACVWVSRDDGATWEVSYSNPTTEGVWPSRFYLFGDTLCIYDASSSNWLTYDGTSVWTPGDITGGAYPNPYDAYQNDSVHARISVAFNNSADCDVYIAQGNIIGDPTKSVYAGMYLQQFNGLAKRGYMGLGDAKTGIPCVDSGGFRIYIVDADRKVFSFATNSVDTTQQLEFQLPALSTDVWGELGPMCLAVDSQRNVLYWGGFDGTIYSANLPVRIS